MTKNHDEENQIEKSIDSKTICWKELPTHYEMYFLDDFKETYEDTVYIQLIQDLKNGNKEKELHIFIHSYGGNVNTMILLKQQIVKYEWVVTIGLGEIDSNGFMLWSLGDERFLDELTMCMYHGISSGNYGKVTELMSHSKFLERIQTEFEKIVEDILPKEEIMEGRTTEKWYLGKELIERGISKDYREYENRDVLIEGKVFVYRDKLYLKDGNLFFEVGIVSEDGKTREELNKPNFIEFWKECHKSEIGEIRGIKKEMEEFFGKKLTKEEVRLMIGEELKFRETTKEIIVLKEKEND